VSKENIAIVLNIVFQAKHATAENHRNGETEKLQDMTELGVWGMIYSVKTEVTISYIIMYLFSNIEPFAEC
jgi:hypothetical protein